MHHLIKSISHNNRVAFKHSPKNLDIQPTHYTVSCMATSDRKQLPEIIRNGALSMALGAALFIATPSTATASNQRLPPLDTDPNHCERAFVGNTIGQANAVSDKVLDLRLCDLSGKSLVGKTLSGALMVDTNLSKANLREVVMSKAYAVKVNLSGADLTNSGMCNMWFRFVFVIAISLLLIYGYKLPATQWFLR